MTEPAADVGRAPHLPEQPVQRLGALVGIRRQECAEFFCEIEQDRSGLEHATRLGTAPIHQGWNLRVRVHALQSHCQIARPCRCRSTRHRTRRRCGRARAALPTSRSLSRRWAFHANRAARDAFPPATPRHVSARQWAGSHPSTATLRVRAVFPMSRPLAECSCCCCSSLSSLAGDTIDIGECRTGCVCQQATSGLTRRGPLSRDLQDGPCTTCWRYQERRTSSPVVSMPPHKQGWQPMRVEIEYCGQ